MQIAIQNDRATCVMDAAIASDGIRQMIADIKVKELLGGMSDCSAVTVDLSSTERADAVGLLFLISLQKTYTAQKKKVTFTGCGEGLRKTFTALGLNDLFETAGQGGDGNERT